MLAVSIIILLILSFQVMPVALGINNAKMNILHIASSIFLLIFGQVLLFLLGVLLGDRFMYLVVGFKRYILFIGFFIIAARMFIEALEIRKGKRTYLVEKANQFILPSIAQAINTFLAGILFYLLIFDLGRALIYLGIFSLSFSVPFVFIKNERLPMLAVSLVYMVGGILMALLSFYLLFI